MKKIILISCLSGHFLNHFPKLAFDEMEASLIKTKIIITGSFRHVIIQLQLTLKGKKQNMVAQMTIEVLWIFLENGDNGDGAETQSGTARGQRGRTTPGRESCQRRQKGTNENAFISPSFFTKTGI